MSVNRPLNIPGRRKVITKNMILEAQKHTKSNMAAARWMNVCYTTYKKWAKYYNLFEQHKNQTGVGITKGWASRTTNVEEDRTDQEARPRPCPRYPDRVYRSGTVVGLIGFDCRLAGGVSPRTFCRAKSSKYPRNSLKTQELQGFFNYFQENEHLFDRG